MPHFKPTGPISLQGSGKKVQVTEWPAVGLKVLSGGTTGAGQGQQYGSAAAVHPADLTALSTQTAVQSAAAATGTADAAVPRDSKGASGREGGGMVGDLDQAGVTTVGATDGKEAATAANLAGSGAAAVTAASSSFLQLASGSDCVLTVRADVAVPHGCILLDEVQLFNLHLLAGDTHKFRRYPAPAEAPQPLLELEGEVRLLHAPHDGSSAAVQVDAQQLSAALSRAYFGRMVAVNELLVVTLSGLQLLIRVTAAHTLSEEEREETIGYHCYRGLLTPLTTIYLSARDTTDADDGLSASHHLHGTLGPSLAANGSAGGSSTDRVNGTAGTVRDAGSINGKVSPTGDDTCGASGVHGGSSTSLANGRGTGVTGGFERCSLAATEGTANAAAELGALRLGPETSPGNGMGAGAGNRRHEHSGDPDVGTASRGDGQNEHGVTAGLVLLNARCRAERPPPKDVVHVTSSDGEWFPVKKQLLRPCVALTKAVRDSGDTAPSVTVAVDCLTFDRVLLFLEAHLLHKLPPQWSLHLVDDLAKAATVLGLQPLADYCAVRLHQLAPRVKVHRYADIVAANARGEVWLILDSMVLDVKAWLPEHPGGATIIPRQSLNVDCARFFEMYHASRESFLYLRDFYIGELHPDDRLAVPQGGADKATGKAAEPPGEDFLQQLREYTHAFRLQLSAGAVKSHLGSKA